jgi:hypothetical protein
MILEQALKRIQDKESQITNLQKEIRETKAALKNITPYKIGDKVRVDWGTNTSEDCYIADVHYNSYHKDLYEYKFNKIKKDGTMSQQSAGIYRYSNVTLIERAKTEEDYTINVLTKNNIKTRSSCSCYVYMDDKEGE